MTYRERRLRKAERLREWAEKREQKGQSHLANVRALADSIPLGQPILVGHHSEAHARHDVERIDSGTRNGIENLSKAEEFRSRASNIEKAADHAIYSDDEDAVERLEERIAELEQERAEIKAFNKACKTGGRDVSMLSPKNQAELLSVAKYAAYQLGKNGEFPAYVLTNLAGNINRQKKRLEALKAL